MKSNRVYIGLDFGATKTIAASADENGNIIEKIRENTPQKLDEGMELFKRMIREVSGGEKITAIGCATGGPLDWKTGIINFLHMPEWRDVPLKDIMEKEFDCPFYVDNDCNVAALGEIEFGEGLNYNDFIYITISTGFGAGIIKDQKIFRSSSGEHPELGHQTVHTKKLSDVICRCGATNCLESLISGYAIERHYGKHAEQLTDGEWNEIGTLLGEGLRNIIVMHTPEVIFLGGGVALGGGEKLLRTVTEVIKKQVKIVKLPEVKLTPLGYEAPLKGAVALAMKGFE
ncbi:MAG: ROK family protein [Candidatus Aenigmarchaeota archaeon]|nr:ROK family protein [Candidatus Aenigmarchaeota archaeon]